MILSMDYQNDILSSDMNGSRRYSMANNLDGTISLTDKTSYDQTGTDFGAGDVNKITASIMGFTNETIVFSSDGNTITDTDGNGRNRVTVFSTNSSGLDIVTETLYDADGTVTGAKVTTFNADGSISEEVTQ